MKKSLLTLCVASLCLFNVAASDSNSLSLSEVAPCISEKESTTIIQNGLYELSRGPMGSENPEPLLDVVGDNIDISEIRYIDAKTLISGMCLPKVYKMYLINLLDDKNPSRNKEISCPLFFADTQAVSDTEKKFFQNHVINTFQNGINECSIYRDMAITLMGYSEHIRQCDKIEIYGKIGKSIFKNEKLYEYVAKKLGYVEPTQQRNECESYEKGKDILKNEQLPPFMLIAACEALCDFTPLDIYCLRGCSDKMLRKSADVQVHLTSHINFSHCCLQPEFTDPVNLAVKPYCPGYPAVLYHELGHVLFGTIMETEISNSDAWEMHSISSKIVDVGQNEAYFDESKRCPVNEKCSDTSSEVAIKKVKKIGSSSIGKILFDSRSEICQILGYFLGKHDGHYIMYINLLSDFNVSLVSGKPIRIDHSGLMKGDNWVDYLNDRWEKVYSTDSAEKCSNEREKKESSATCEKGPIASIAPNLAFIELLMQAYGVSMDEYQKHLAARTFVP